MEKYEKLLNMLMDFNESIRFAAVADSSGEMLWNSQREGVKNIVPLEETKQTIKRVINSWNENSTLDSELGSGLYSIASYDKIKRISVPLNDGDVLFITTNNTPLKKSKSKSYGQIAEMGKILSIVEFVNSKK